MTIKRGTYKPFSSNEEFAINSVFTPKGNHIIMQELPFTRRVVVFIQGCPTSLKYFRKMETAERYAQRLCRNER